MALRMYCIVFHFEENLNSHFYIIMSYVVIGDVDIYEVKRSHHQHLAGIENNGLSSRQSKKKILHSIGIRQSDFSG